MANQFDSVFGGAKEAPEDPKQTPSNKFDELFAPALKGAFSGSVEDAPMEAPSDPGAQVPELITPDDTGPIDKLVARGLLSVANFGEAREQFTEELGGVGRALPDLFKQTFQGAKMGVLASRVYGQDAISQQGTRPGMEGSIGPASMFPTEIAQQEAEKAKQFLALPDDAVKPFSEELEEVYSSPSMQEALKSYKESAQAIQAIRDEVDAGLTFDVFSMAAKMLPSVAVGTVTRSPNTALSIMFGQVYADKTAELNARGVDPEAVPVHAFATSTIETMTEKIPFNYLLKNVGWNGVKKLLNFTVLEGAQESASSLLQSAWDKGTLNPDLTLKEALHDAGYEGLVGTLGAPIVGGPAILYQKFSDQYRNERLKVEMQKMEEAIRAKIKSGEIQGPFVPQEVEQQKEEVNKFEQILQEEAAKPDVKLDPSVNEFLQEEQLRLGELLELNTRGKGMLGEQLTEQVKPALPNYKGGDQQAPGEVVDSGFNHYQTQLQYAKLRKEQLEAMTPEDMAARSVEEQMELTEELDTVNEDIQKLEHLAALEAEWGQAVRAQVQDMVKRFAPDMKVYIGDAAMSARLRDVGFEELGSSHGRTFRMADGVQVIEFDFASLLDHSGNFVPGLLRESTAHEFGHALINEMFENESPAVRKAVTDSYLKWLNKATKEQSLNKFAKARHGFFWNKVNLPGQGTIRHKASLEDFIERMKRSAERRLMQEATTGRIEVKTMEDYNRILDRRIRDRLNYEFGMTEWTAIQSEKIIPSEESQNPEVKKYFNRIDGFLRKLYNHYKDSYGYDKSYQTFLRLMQARASYKAAVDTYLEAKEEYLDRSYDEIVEEQVGTMMRKALSQGFVDGGGGQVPPGAYSYDDFKGDFDTYNEALRYGITLTQLAKLNKHISGLQQYLGRTQEWWNTKMDWTARADERLVQWKNLGGKRAERLGKFLLDLTVKSYDSGKRFTVQDKEFQELAERWGLDREQLALYDMIEGDFKAVLEELKAALIADANRQFVDDPQGLQEAINDLNKEFAELENLNYFPLSRFGQYFVRVRTMRDQVIEGREYKTGDITSFEAFESKKAMDKRLRQLERSKDLKAVGGVMTDIQRQFVGFPPQFIQMLKNRLELTDEQQSELSKLLHDLAPGQSYKKHLKHRKNVPGFNQDAIRSYANYFLHFSNHIARVKYKNQLLDAIKEVSDSAETLRDERGEAVKRDKITQWMQRHYEYIMNPGNELANLRALGFLWYLGFVPKSAAVNLTQVPLVTLPYLSARYGDVQAMKALTKATKDVVDYWRRPQKLTPGQHAMLETLKKTGIIDESMATELAATSEGSVLQRLAPGPFLKSPTAGRFVRDMAGRAAWMFQQAEKFNRRISALAAYDLAKKKGMSHDRAVQEAQEAVESTQYEYARWNRAEFMRNKRSVFFLFWQYLQNTMFFAAQDPGSSRFLVMLLLMAGISGLPFAEDLMDLYDYIAKKFNKRAGGEQLPPNSRIALRQFIAELGANPDLIMHGASRYTFGLPAVGDAIGVPIPNVDMSGSISMGRIIPGMDAMFGQQGQFDERFARSLQEAGGAVLSMPIELLRAIADDNPNTLKRFERAMPSFARNLSKAYRYAAEGEEKLRGGATLAEFDLQESKHVAEILFQAAGFAPTRVQELKEKYYLTKELAMYYEIRRRQFMRMLDFARGNEDKMMEADVWKEIQNFNKTVPHPALRLGPKDIKNSLKQRIRDRALIEQGIYTTKRGIQMQEGVDKAFPTEEPAPAEEQKGQPSRSFEEVFEEPVPK